MLNRPKLPLKSLLFLVALFFAACVEQKGIREELIDVVARYVAANEPNTAVPPSYSFELKEQAENWVVRVPVLEIRPARAWIDYYVDKKKMQVMRVGRSIDLR